jgi:hypothetical protein
MHSSPCNGFVMRVLQEGAGVWLVCGRHPVSSLWVVSSLWRRWWSRRVDGGEHDEGKNEKGDAGGRGLKRIRPSPRMRPTLCLPFLAEQCYAHIAETAPGVSPRSQAREGCPLTAALSACLLPGRCCGDERVVDGGRDGPDQTYSSTPHCSHAVLLHAD